MINWEIILRYSMGFGYSVIMNQIFTRSIINNAWRILGWNGGMMNEDDRPQTWTVWPIGFFESIIFPSVWLIGKSEFIALWLALKYAASWNRWSGEVADKNDNYQSDTMNNKSEQTAKIIKISGRQVFNIFLLGSGLSIVHGVVGGMIINWYYNRQNVPLIFVPMLVIIFTFIIWFYVKMAQYIKTAKGTNGSTIVNIPLAVYKDKIRFIKFVFRSPVS